MIGTALDWAATLLATTSVLSGAWCWGFIHGRRVQADEDAELARWMDARVRGETHDS